MVFSAGAVCVVGSISSLHQQGRGSGQRHQEGPQASLLRFSERSIVVASVGTFSAMKQDGVMDRGRSSVDPSLFFVGFDQAVNGGLSMGFWGWSCGFIIAQGLGQGL